MHPDIIEPTHKKGRESQQRIVEATLALIERTPFDQITIAEIMEEAGMAVGTFYRRFKAKESVLPFVFKAYDDLFEDWARSFEQEEAETRDEAIELIVSKTALLFSKHAGLIRTVHLYNRLHPGMSATQPNRRELSALMGGLLAKNFSHPTKDDLVRGRMAVLTMVSVMTEHFLYRDLAPAKTANLRNRDVQDLLAKMLKALAA
jgi:AcrR family transcriptional regulator